MQRTHKRTSDKDRSKSKMQQVKIVASVASERWDFSALSSTILVLWGRLQPWQVYLKGGGIGALAHTRAPQARQKLCFRATRFEADLLHKIQTPRTWRAVIKRAWAHNYLAPLAKIENDNLNNLPAMWDRCKLKSTKCQCFSWWYKWRDRRSAVTLHLNAVQCPRRHQGHGVHWALQNLPTRSHI
jgi:hypothetical protein